MLIFADRTSETGRSLLRGIDVNRMPPSSTADCEEEAAMSSPNSTVSSVSGKRSEREMNGEDLDGDRACSRGISDEEDGETSRKKLRLTKDQSAVLEESFKEHNTLNPVSLQTQTGRTRPERLLFLFFFFFPRNFLGSQTVFMMMEKFMGVFW